MGAKRRRPSCGGGTSTNSVPAKATGRATVKSMQIIRITTLVWPLFATSEQKIGLNVAVLFSSCLRFYDMKAAIKATYTSQKQSTPKARKSTPWMSKLFLSESAHKGHHQQK